MKKIPWMFFILLLLSISIISGCYKYSNNQSSNTSQAIAKKETVSNNRQNEIIPIVVDSLLIGGYYQGKWVKKDEIVSKINGGETYQLYSAKKFFGNAKGSKPTTDEEFREDYFIEMEVEPEMELADDEESPSIAIGTTSDLNFKSVVEKDNIFYEEKMSNYFNNKRLTQYKLNVIQGISIDLDNDQKEEHFISSNDYNNQDILGDGWYKVGKNYSFLVLSKDGLDTAVIKEALFEKAGTMAKFLNIDEDTDVVFRSHYYILGVIDIDGDGVKEIISREEIQDGTLYSVFQYKNGVFYELLNEGIGR